MIRLLVAIALAFFFVVPVSTGHAQGSTSAPDNGGIEGGPVILAFGDSLTAGYGLDEGLGFAPQLEDALRREGLPATVIDGGVSGDTSAAGLARVDWTLDSMERAPDLVILELGGNDMLRALDPAATARNLDALVDAFEARGARVMLAGMRAAPSYDAAYIERFEAIYPELAERRDLPLYPFFLENVVGEPGMMLPDGIHPRFAGIKRMVTGIRPMVVDRLGTIASD